MSTWSVPALLQIYIDERPGQWVPLAHLVAYVALPMEQVRECAERLVVAGAVHFAQRDGTYFYGVQVEGQQP